MSSLNKAFPSGNSRTPQSPRIPHGKELNSPRFVTAQKAQSTWLTLKDRTFDLLLLAGHSHKQIADDPNKECHYQITLNLKDLAYPLHITYSSAEKAQCDEDYRKINMIHKVWQNNPTAIFAAEKSAYETNLNCFLEYLDSIKLVKKTNPRIFKEEIEKAQKIWTDFKAVRIPPYCLRKDRKLLRGIASELNQLFDRSHKKGNSSS